MKRVTSAVIGAGHAGLAMSWQLTRRGIEHVVLERGQVANSWRQERWDSLRLLTPNWQSRLPGYGYRGAEPDSFRSMAETVEFITSYAAEIGAPVHCDTRVTAVRQRGEGYEVISSTGAWHCDSVVLASCACNLAVLPPVAAALPAGIASLHAFDYRRPDQLEPGGVLVVGASASGSQISDELRRAGRDVIIAVGEHVRVPRLYRGRDIKWWMDAAGVLNERYDAIEDLRRARNLPSLQLAGYPDRRSIDLNALAALGVKLVGRLAGFNGSKAQFSGSLRNVCALADLKMNRLLNALDTWADETGQSEQVGPVERFPATEVEASPPLLIDLPRAGVKTILWATGYRPDYSWLELPLLDAKGYVRHDGGVVEAPGLYLLGMPFLRRRKSTLIDGAADDSADLAEHLHGYLSGRSRRQVVGVEHVASGAAE